MNQARPFLFTALLLVSCADSGAHATAAPAPDPGVTVGAPQARPPLFAVPVTGLPVLGASTALVTLVEFTDYDCPYCARAEGTIHALRDKYGDDLRVAVAENPLPMHPQARGAALFALATVAQGDFEAAHDGLFAHRDAHSKEGLVALGTQLGLRAPSSRANDDAVSALERAATLAVSLHVNAAPTFFVNGRKITGAQPFRDFDLTVSEELDHARALVQSGVPRSEVYTQILAEAQAHPAALDDVEPMPFSAEAKTAGGAHLYGARSAPKTILLFTDYACPYCAKLDARLRAFVETHTDVRVALRQHPLPMHADARLAAKAALAADAQGALTPFSALLFANQSALGRDALLGYADRAGLERTRFVRDLDAPETERRLEEDEALAMKLGVTGTPTSFAEGRKVDGAQQNGTVERALAL